MIEITRIERQDQFSADWCTLDVWIFGPLCDLPFDADDGDAKESDIVLLAVENGETVGYLTADTAGVWCVEVKPSHRRRGIARRLVEASGANTFCEVCGEDGLALANALNMEVDNG